MEFSLSPKKLSVLKGQVGESVAWSFINEVTIPKLKREGGYDKAVYWRSDLSEFEKNPFETRRERCAGIFLFHGLLPTEGTLARFESLLGTLKTHPDGLLFKVTKNGRELIVKDALKNLGMRVAIPRSYGSGESIRLPPVRLELDSQMPEVEADIEFVEVKTDSGDFRAKQAQDYTEALRNGFHLRVVAVKIVSLANNQFDVADVLVTEP